MRVKELLLTEGNARNLYPDEVERWFGFLRVNHREVENFLEWANALASRHELSPLQPLAVTPALLRKRDHELELEGQQVTEPRSSPRVPIACLVALESLEARAVQECCGTALFGLRPVC